MCSKPVCHLVCDQLVLYCFVLFGLVDLVLLSSLTFAIPQSERAEKWLVEVDAKDENDSSWNGGRKKAVMEHLIALWWELGLEDVNSIIHFSHHLGSVLFSSY